MQPRTLALLTLALLVLPACAVDDELDFRTTAGSGGGTSAGTVFNTHYVEKVAVSELLPLGAGGLGLSLDEIILSDGVEAASYQVVDGALTVLDVEGKLRAGDDLIDSEWRLRKADWLVYRKMRLLKIDADESGPRYVFEHPSIEANGWVNNCVDSGAGVPAARLLTGFTLDTYTGALTAADDTSFIACSTGAVGKAADWGYYDLAVAAGDLALFETAIRVVRADYCYDGTSWTKAGVPLIVDDGSGLPRRFDGGAELLVEKSVADVPIEAVWGRNGLICAGDVGRNEFSAGKVCPDLKTKYCEPGTTLDQYPGGLIMTRVPSGSDTLLPAEPLVVDE
jgi:hypothetical protein